MQRNTEKTSGSLASAGALGGEGAFVGSQERQELSRWKMCHLMGRFCKKELERRQGAKWVFFGG